MAEYLVTGETSFIASHVVKALLDLGYFVRTTVRDFSDEEKVRFLWELKGAKERMKIFEADLTVDGSFDDAVKGVDGVFHIASTISVCMDDNDLEKLADRDIYGIRNLMNSCEKSRNTVRRIVLTSSSTSVRYSYDATKASPLKESHWSDLEYCRSFRIWYGYAKTLVEKESWLIAAEKNLNLVVVIPSFCIGPILSPKPTSSPSIFLSIIKGVPGEYPNSRGGCGSEEGRDMPHSLDTRKIHELGFGSFNSLAEMFDDCIKCFQEKGLL
ncbi:hypothetical protein Bca4012_071667 [Brassica carinata]